MVYVTTIKYKINEDELRKAIEETIYTAANFYNRHNSGQVQLYGIVNKETGTIDELKSTVLTSTNSWVEGENIITLFTQSWFDPLFNEDYKEWFAGEEEAKEYEEWEDFCKKEPEKWLDKLNQWREIWLDVNMPDMVYEVLRRIDDIGEIEIV